MQGLENGASPLAIRSRSAISCFGDTAESHVAALKAGRTGLLPIPSARGLGETSAATMEAGIEAEDQRPYALTDAVVRALGLTPQELRESALFVGTCTGVSASEEICLRTLDIPLSKQGALRAAHFNAILERVTTAEEQRYLDEGGYKG